VFTVHVKYQAICAILLSTILWFTLKFLAYAVSQDAAFIYSCTKSHALIVIFSVLTQYVVVAHGFTHE